MRKISPEDLILAILKNQIQSLSKTEILERSLNRVVVGRDFSRMEETRKKLEKSFEKLLREKSFHVVEEGGLTRYRIAQDVSEKSLYEPLVAWLKGRGVEARILSAQKARRGKRGSNLYRYPDIVGVKRNVMSSAVRTVVERTGEAIFELYGYEVKSRLDTGNVREARRQCLENSSWANRRYLVAEHIEEEAFRELEKENILNSVGLIHLSVNRSAEPFLPDRRTKLLLESPFLRVDNDAIDRLYKNWDDFRDWIDSLSL